MRFLRPITMPKTKSKTAAKRLKVLDEELVDGAETAGRIAATETVADDALFADDRAGATKASKRAAAAAAAGAAPSSASAAVVSKSAAPSKALVYSRPAKAAKPQSEVERRKIEMLVERAAAGDMAAISAVPGRKKIAARSAVGDLWGVDEAKASSAAVPVPDEALVPALVKPAALSGLKRKTPYASVKSVAQAAAAGEASLESGAKAAAKAAASASAAAAAPADAAASADGAAGEAAVAKPKSGKGRRQKRRELAAAVAAGAAPKGVSSTLTGAAEGGLSYHPTKADHETAVLRAAHAELAAQALRKTKAQLAKEAKAAAAGRAMAADSDDDDDDSDDESSDGEDAGAAGGAAAVALAIKPVKAAAKASRRPVMVPLSDELTGSLRTAKHVAPGALARDLMRDIASAGLVTEKKFGRSTGQKASRISKKRSKAVEFPRKPAAAFGVIKGDSGDW